MSDPAAGDGAPRPYAPDLAAFDHAPRTRLIYGPGMLDRLGSLARELGLRRVLVVTDPGVAAAGHAAAALDHLRAAGVDAALFDRTPENPTTTDVEACRAAAAALAGGCAGFVGVGGGSALDTAKGANFLLTNGGAMADYRGFGKATRSLLPLIAVPTTAGTGSEMQSYALIADAATHAKMACGDATAAPRIALLDPVLTVSCPPRATACAGLDALAHAVETAVTARRNGVSLLYSHRAFALLHASLPRVLATPGDLPARGRMLLGAAYAGAAIEASMLGAAHAAANPLTARFPLAHGHAVALLLPHVIRWNAEDPATRLAYYELALRAGLAGIGSSPDRVAEELADLAADLLAGSGLPSTLAAAGVPAAALDALAPEAAAQWTAGFNPRPVGVQQFRALYSAAHGGG